MKATTKTTQPLSDWVISRIDHSTQNPNVGFVETLYHTCSTALEHLEEGCSQPPAVGRELPPGHLDTILGQSSHLKRNIVENLKGIGNNLMPYFADWDRTTTSGLNERSTAWDLAQELDTQLQKAAIVLSAEESSDSSSDDEISDDSSSTTEREQNRFGRIHSYVSCLMDLAAVIDKRISLLHHKVESPPTALENVIRLSQSAQPFAMRIQDRFEISLTPLVERLAEANWERSIRIRAREEEPDLAVNDGVTLFKPYSLFNDSGLGTSVPTRSQYAATTASHTSFLSIAGKEAHGRPRVPSVPQEGGLPFQCDYCGKTISPRNRIEWKIHVFADLQSYLCTHAECKDALKTFPSRKLWADHEFNEHFTRIQWRCFICNTTAVTQQLFVDHLILCHDIALAGHRLTAAISEAQETDLKLEFKDHKCALCSQDGWQTKKAYATHVGQHLEEISLACLPRDESGSSDVELNSDTSSNATKGNLLKPFFNDRQEAYTDLAGPTLRAAEDLAALPSFVDAPARLCNEQKDMAQLGVEPTEEPASQGVAFDPEAERKLMDNTIPTDAVGVIDASRSGEVQLKHTSSSEQQSMSPLQHHLTPPIPQSYPGEDFPWLLQDFEPQAKEETNAFDASASTKKPDIDYGSLKPTSYWSVSEQRDFTILLSHFGRDFEGISRFMKTKTTTMVKNFYQRSVDAGQKEFEYIVTQTEDKKARGEPTGLLPVPNVTPERRYEATYSNATHHRTQADNLHSRKTDTLEVPTSLSEIQRIAAKHAQAQLAAQQKKKVPLHSQRLIEAQLRRAQDAQKIAKREQEIQDAQSQQQGDRQLTSQERQQQLMSAATQTNDSPMDQNVQPIRNADRERYIYLYQERVLRMRHDMSQRYITQYGPPNQYPPDIALESCNVRGKAAGRI
ncbi:hypothetical protein N7527_004707 [Penicillium freii]|nr:hypothetical protein N7527_004707 [Penicillium freii]